MCCSAQIWADFRKYERFDGKLNIKEFTKLAGWTKKKSAWVKVVPKAMRQAMTNATSGVLDLGTVELAREADAEATPLGPPGQSSRSFCACRTPRRAALHVAATHRVAA